MIKVEHSFNSRSEGIKEEIVRTLVDTRNCTIEEIFSPPGTRGPKNREWYDSERNELVILVNGEADLLFEEGNQRIKLLKGDYINIPAHSRHRLESTHPRKSTIWRTVYYR